MAATSAIGMLSSGVFFSVPECCYERCKKDDWIRNLFLAFKIIKGTKTGQEVLKDIAASGRKVTILPHAESEKNCCKKVQFPEENTQCDVNSYDPNEQYDSAIFWDPRWIKKGYKYFTHHHYKQCVSKCLVAKTCNDEDSPCNRQYSIVDILFHELVHARNSVLGKKQMHITNVSEDYGNMEEAVAIGKTNQLLRELHPKENPDKLLRYGHTSCALTKKASHGYSEGAAFFLRFTAPALIASSGKEYADFLKSISKEKEKEKLDPPSG